MVEERKIAQFENKFQAIEGQDSLRSAIDPDLVLWNGTGSVVLDAMAWHFEFRWNPRSGAVM